VGCVVADADGRVVGEGFYLYEGVKHAETLALEQAGARARGATAYVSLEPHAHTGRTPPCTTALIEAGVGRVVAAIDDPNPLVSGRGFEHLRAAGVEVTTGVLADEAARLNEQYVHAMRRGRPFVHLKLACSLDGRIATRAGDARWITGGESRARVHELRHRYDAILVGAGTAVKDDPLLTDRSGLPRRRPLVRVVLDERLQICAGSQLVRTAREEPLVVFTSARADERKVRELEERGAEVVRDSAGWREPVAVLEYLFRRSIHGVLVEGGAHVAGVFLEAGAVEKVSFFVAPIIIGGADAKAAVGGTGALNVDEAVELSGVEMTPRGRDIEITGYPRKSEDGSSR
jgi:diaminohydroxyphosphoribosylaminopyrimidine deaminase/5-amino-6-(5-phosphoribosylamino)uracil reductase